MTHKMFTKSAFKQALTCPASMKYYHDSDEYANQNNGDDFLQALADGGNQAGDLAKVYYGIAQGPRTTSMCSTMRRPGEGPTPSCSLTR